MVKITFIRQSSFLLEWDKSIWVFDYFAGDIPEISGQKSLFVFASHGHKDHFSEDVFALAQNHEDVRFVLSDDIRNRPGDGGTRMPAGEQVCYVKSDEQYVFDDGSGSPIRLRTFRSTDVGVAFLLEYQDRTIYHAGDLHWWIWKGEDEAEAISMQKAFFHEMNKLCGVDIDIAFLPLDPRLEESFAAGFDVAMRTANIRYAFPMHFWGDPSVNERLLAHEISAPYRSRVIPVMAEGQLVRLFL